MVKAIALCCITSALAASVERAALSSRSDWQVLSEAKPDAEHEVTLAVRQQNLAALHDKLMDVSDPDSPNRGKYMTFSEVQEMTTNKASVEAVESFLRKSNVNFSRVDVHGNYIKVKGAVSALESMFSTDIQVVQSVEGSQPLLRAVKETVLPEEIAEHVSGVFRLNSLPPVMRPLPQINSLANASANAGTPVTPAGIKQFYNVQGSGSAAQSQCVFESLGQYTSPSDLASFEQKYDVPGAKIAKDVGGHVDGSQCSNPNNCAEANLDVQYMIAMAPETPLTYWYDSNQQTPFEDWIEQVARTSNPPLVNSISYGGIESSVPSSVTSAFDTEAMKLGVQGVTVFVSSGDDGVANFQARTSKAQCGYNPSYPASSPYVTAVGATQGGINGGAEIVCSSKTGGQITTGGGFSTKYDQPAYQKEAVAAYLSSSAGQSAMSGYAVSGRAYPDISMAGFNYEVVINGQVEGVSGTSASSPVVAGFAALVNAKLAANGGSSLGFINPTLYKAGSGSFNDITSGNNKCAAQGLFRTVCCDQGFEATSGWDPLTGLGSVDYAKFEALFTSGSVVV